MRFTTVIVFDPSPVSNGSTVAALDVANILRLFSSVVATNAVLLLVDFFPLCSPLLVDVLCEPAETFAVALPLQH